MSNHDHHIDVQTISYDELQAHIARGRAMQAEYIAAGLRKLGRILVGRGSKPAATKGQGVTGHPA